MGSSVQGEAGRVSGETQEKAKTVAVPNEIAQNLKVADEDASFRYDESARNFVAQKPVLAYILKSSLDEYAEYTVQEIAAGFIEGDPQVRMVAVHPDHPDKTGGTAGGSGSSEAGVDTDSVTGSIAGSEARLAAGSDAGAGNPETMDGDDRVEGLSTVDKSQRDGTIYYDIRFLALLPTSGDLAEIFVNCEIQSNDTPGYPIPKRGIYYAARMISSQRGTTFKDQEYQKIKKTVSIWVCEDTSGARSDTINRYSFAEECLRGGFREEKKNYDLMTVVVLRLGIRGVESGDNAIRLLSKIFSMELNYEEKIDALLNEFQISVTREISEEVLNVCNLSAGVYNKGYGTGYDTGLSAGEKKKAQATAYRLWDKGMPVREIADMIEVGMDTLQGWLAERPKLLAK